MIQRTGSVLVLEDVGDDIGIEHLIGELTGLGVLPEFVFLLLLGV